jgi:Ohr subfamily peroxiredoxin
MGKAARKLQLALPPDTAIDAEIDLGMVGDDFQLQARLTVSVPGLDSAQTQALVEEAHRTCPYSKATRGNIDVRISVA